MLQLLIFGGKEEQWRMLTASNCYVQSSCYLFDLSMELSWDSLLHVCFCLRVIKRGSWFIKLDGGREINALSS